MIQYFCDNPKRLQLVREHATLNAIDYLEVLDHNAPPALGIDPRQRTLLVHCLRPIPAFTQDNVRIVGGVRVIVEVEWAHPALAIPAGLVTPEEQTFFTSLDDADRVLVIRTDSTGDFSIYRLSLTKSASEPEPPDDFDNLLSQITFSFKVECPSDFDCQPVESCPPESLPQPHIDYLAKDYASFRRLILDRLAIIMPDWQERNPADLGIALVEVLAYAADYLSYYQDAVATEAYLGSARQRISLRRHTRLLDYPMHEGCNARAWVYFEVEPLGAADGLLLPAGAQLMTKTTAPRGSITSEALAAALAEGGQVFETMHDLTLRSALNEIPFYTWGDDACCLPKGATQATLDGSAAEIPLQAGDLLLFEEARSPATGQPEDADPAQRHAVRLRQTPVEQSDKLTGQKVLEITWDAADALPFPLCLWQVDDGSGALQPVSVARGNVVLADSGLTISGQALIPDTVPDNGRYRPFLPETDITHRVPYDHNQARTEAAALALAQDPKQALPDAMLFSLDPATSTSDSWTAQRDLLDGDRFDQVFVLEMDEDGRGHLRFGDDTLGQQPAAGLRFTATYRIGNGRSGNVGAEAIAHVAINGLSNVRNPRPATGGTDPEPMEQVRLYAPQAFRTQERAVTEADYTTMALRHSDVQKAVATLRWTGSWHTMFVTVDRKGGRPVDADFEEELRDFLGSYRLSGHDLEIEPPVFVPLDIAMTVCVAPTYFRDKVKQALLELFSSVDLPDGRRGFFHPDNFTFGQPVYLSQVVAMAMAVPGVSWVEVDETPPKFNRFHRWGQAPRGEVADGRITLGRLEIARLDNNPSQPENGRLEFFMEGGL